MVHGGDYASVGWGVADLDSMPRELEGGSEMKTTMASLRKVRYSTGQSSNIQRWSTSATNDVLKC